MSMRRILHGAVAALTAAAVLVGLQPTTAQAAAPWTTLQNRKATYDARYQYLAISGGVTAPNGADAIVYSFSTSGGAVVGDQQWWMQDLGNGQFYLRNNATSKAPALSVKGNDWHNGTHVVQWVYDPDNLWQRWTTINHSGGWWQFRNVAATNVAGHDVCLAIEGGGSATIPRGAPLILWTCGAGEDQQWHDDTFE